METKLKNKSKQTSLRRSHHFWVMSDEIRVINDRNTKNQTAPSLLTDTLNHPKTKFSLITLM